MQSAPQPSERQIALFVSLAIGAVVAGLTIITFWWIFSLALAPDLKTAAADAQAPYNGSDGVTAIVEAEPNEPTDGREPWLGEDAWRVAVQKGQEYISQYPEPQNVQVLKGMTTAQIWVYMQQHVSGAMGVSCQYCHDINNYAADPYPAKISARLMLLLVRDLNAQFIANIPNWRGNYVQCATCHNLQPVDMATFSPQFDNSVPPIQVDLEPLDENGEPMRGFEQNIPLKQAVLYYLYNYRIWNPYDAQDPTSGRGSLSLTHEGGRTQDQVTINQNVMNLMGWSLGEGCTYCHNSRNFYAYEADIPAPQFMETYALNRLKSQHMLLMTTWMTQNWNRYVLPPTDAPDSFPIDGNQYIVEFDGTRYPVAGCYTCHQGNAIPRAAINMADIPEGEAGIGVFPPVLTGLITLDEAEQGMVP